MSYKDFITHVKQIGMFGGNKFEFVAPLVEGGSNADSAKVSMLCNSAQIPGLNIMTTDIRYYGEATERPHGITYGPLNLTFYLDNDLAPKRYFEEWMNQVYSRDKRSLNYYDIYTRDVEVVIYNKAEEEIDRIKFLECYPKLMSDVNLSYDSNGAAVVLSVTLVYKWWESMSKTSYDERLNREESTHNKDKFGFDGLGDGPESFTNYTGNTSFGPGFINDLTRDFDDNDKFSAFSNAGGAFTGDISRNMRTAGDLFNLSDLQSIGYPTLNSMLGDNAHDMFGNLQSIGFGLNEIGGSAISSGSFIQTQLGNISSSISGLSNNLGLYNGLTSSLGAGMGPQFNQVVNQMNQIGGSLSGISSINNIVPQMTSLSANLSRVGSMISSSIPLMVRESGIDRTAQTAFNSASRSFATASHNFTRIASSILR